MSFYAITFKEEEEAIQKFTGLPAKLYEKFDLVQNKQEEIALLTGKHVLSHYFETVGILVLNEKEEAVSRALLTFYAGDETAYLGFYESEDNEEASKLLFQKAEEAAKEKGYQKVTGPVDASFFIKYRLKTNHFDKYYTGEPYNKEYYLKLWQAAGYEIMENYFSNHYKCVPADIRNEKFAERLKEKEAEGYVIKSPTKEDFDSTFLEVYDLMIELYKSFPVYKHITKEEFAELFGYLKSIIRYNMIKMAYYKGKAVGFFISIPNYKNVVYGKLTFFDIIKILKIKAKPKDYVMLYMGVDFSHKGLGKAMAEAIKEELKASQVPSVGALIRKGNINKDYFEELIDFEYEYVLLKKDLG